VARLSRAERIEQACAEMREKQRLLRDGGRAAAVASRPKQTGTPLAPFVGFTWGRPIQRRTKAQVRRAQAAHRREKQAGAEALPKPRCKCGECAACARRARHTETVRNWRAQRAKEGIAE
jgi:hypothetical protein